MFCSQCGADSGTGARFCSACGAKLGGEAAPAGADMVLRPAVAVVRAVPCPRCGNQSAPVSYFARPMNVLKLVVATWFYFFPGLLFYFSRRDRVVCRNCGEWRPGGDIAQAAQGLWLGGGAVLRLAEGGALTLAPRDESAAGLARAARRKKQSALVWGIASLGWVGLVVAGAIGTGGLGVAVGCGALAVWQVVRGGRLEEQARERESRHRMLRVLELAQLRRGRLTVTDVAASLAMDLAEAESTLTAMVDGTHVDMEVDDDGRVRYVFPEMVEAWRPAPLPSSSAAT